MDTPIYDGAGLITIPASVAASRRVTAVRAVLSELHVIQPQLGAVCWCGEPIDVLPRVPEQRRSGQVIKHGA
jgi:hypothetical protein